MIPVFADFMLRSRVVALLILAVGFWGVYQTTSPVYNWDVIPYVGVMYSYTIEDPKELHETTYSTIQSEVSEGRFSELVGRGHYRQTIAKRPEYFVEQLPFYSVKPLYPSLLFLLNELGLSPVKASVVISRIAYVLTILLLFFWTTKYIPFFFAAAISYVVMRNMYMTNIANLSTPDSLSVLYVLFCLYLLTETKHTGKALIILSLSVLIRPDSLILVVLISSIYVASDKLQRGRAIIAISLSVSIYYLEVTLSGNYGWQTLFYHSFVSRLVEPSSFQPSLLIGDYLMVYKRCGIKLLYDSYFTKYLFLNTIAFVLSLAQQRIRNNDASILAATLIFMILHWLTFPGEKERQLASIFVFSIISLLIHCANLKPIFVKFKNLGLAKG